MDTRQKELQDGLKKYEDHLRASADVFNSWAKEKGLHVQMDPTSAIEAVKKGVNLAQVATFWSRPDDTGVVHATQIKTAIDCIVNLLNDSARCGHVVGAMQSGKTTTSLALQWAGPIIYLLKGQRTYPFYIIGNQTGHEDQTNTELEAFVAYYGHVEFKVQQGQEEHADVAPMFKHSPSLATYRGHVLLGALEDVLDVPRLEDLVHRRVGGDQSLRKIADMCRRATDQHYRPLMIIDEPQFGASDRIEINASGDIQHKCVLAQIFDRIEQELGAGSSRSSHWFIGLSATPFEMNDVEKFWEVRQYLTESYSGFNFFNGRPISPDVAIAPPITMSLSRFSESIGIPFLANVVMSAYDIGKPTAFARHARRLRYEGDHATYRGEVEVALRDAIYALLEKDKHDPERPIGLCIRAFNSNAKTDALLQGLSLNPNLIEVIKYYGSDVTGMSVKRAIARRQRRNIPYVIFVTNRARMADAFPTQVRFFMDFALKASDLNALLQGLLGRACGYNKKSTVVLSDDNAEIVEAYVATQGGYVHPTSRHSIPVGFRRGAPTGMLKLRDELDDETVRKFFREINEQVVTPNITPGQSKLSAKRTKGPKGVRREPILLIAERLNLFDHIEEPAVRTSIFPQFPTGFRVARREDTVYHSHERNVPLKYDVDSEGNCRFTFRWTDRQAAAQGGAAGRAKGQKDVGQHMEPTVYVEKYDSKTGEVIDDRLTLSGERKPGHWRAFMVTFPLISHVREVRAATVALPTSQAVYNDWMTPEEQGARNNEEERRGRRAKNR